MRDDGRDPRDEEIEREIRARRGFSTADALGRRDGGGHLKGASPVPRRRQAELEIGEALERRLRDGEGALREVMRQRVESSPQLLDRHPDAPLDALAELLAGLLAGEEALRDLVLDADAAWGRMYGERPRFDRPDRPPEPDDPYTLASVRAALADLLAALSAERRNRD